MARKNSKKQAKLTVSQRLYLACDETATQLLLPRHGAKQRLALATELGQLLASVDREVWLGGVGGKPRK